jgi:CO/xanthine dehydrogenase FAD-binding subunit
VRIALGAVGPTVLRARGAEAWASDRLDWDGERLVPPGVAAEFGERAAAEARPIDDHRSTAAYRRHAVSVLAKRLLERAGA